MSKDNEIMVKEGQELAAAAGLSMEEMMEEMDGLGRLSLDTVKIPSGGGLAFEVPGDDPDSPDIVREIQGVILYRHSANGYWPDPFGSDNKSPVCYSNDGKTGVHMETGEVRACEHCPLNQFADDGTGKACKNMQHLYILRDGDALPIRLVLPPTSIRNLRDYVGKRLLARRKKTSGVVTSITLSKAENKAGVKYAEANFAFKRDLSPKEILECQPLVQLCKDIAASRSAAPAEDFAEV